MNADRHERIMHVFLAASELSGEDQRSYLAETCGDDAELRREVESLLRFHSSKSILAKSRLVTPLAAERVPRLPRNPSKRLSDVPNDPIMAKATPVWRDDSHVQAVLAFAFDVDQEFTQLFSTASLGKTGETYAFDKDVVLLLERRANACESYSIKIVSVDDPHRFESSRQRPGIDVRRFYPTRLVFGAFQWSAKHAHL